MIAKEKAERLIEQKEEETEQSGHRRRHEDDGADGHRHEPQEHSDESYVKDAIRPVIGSSVANAVTERPAEVQAETPKIVDPGEEEAIPTATRPVDGFAPAKREQVKRPKKDIQTTRDEVE